MIFSDKLRLQIAHTSIGYNDEINKVEECYIRILILINTTEFGLMYIWAKIEVLFI